MLRDNIRPIGEYHNHSLEVKPYDPTVVLVAVEVIDLINQELPNAVIEHIGSTSVPQLACSGIIDLLVIAPSSQLQATASGLEVLGFQHLAHPAPASPKHSILVGSYNYRGTVYNIHVHLLADNDMEIYRLRAFRDRLRYDSTLQTTYVAQKRAIIKSGKTNPAEYERIKSDFIKRALNKS